MISNAFSRTYFLMTTRKRFFCNPEPYHTVELFMPPRAKTGIVHASYEVSKPLINAELDPSVFSRVFTTHHGLLKFIHSLLDFLQLDGGTQKAEVG